MLHRAHTANTQVLLMLCLCYGGGGLVCRTSGGGLFIALYIVRCVSTEIAVPPGLWGSWAVPASARCVPRGWNAGRSQMAGCSGGIPWEDLSRWGGGVAEENVRNIYRGVLVQGTWDYHGNFVAFSGKDIRITKGWMITCMYMRQ